MTAPAAPGHAPVVTGRGTYLPDDVLTNADVAGLADPRRLVAFTVTNQWCRQRTEALRAGGERGTAELELARRVYAEFIAERVGIRERRVVDRAGILKGRAARSDLLSSTLAARAGVRALAAAGLLGEDLDAVLCGTSTPDSLCPATAVEVQHLLGAHRAFAFDVMAACTSFAYALTAARALVLAGTARRVLVVAAEYFTSMVDWSDPATSYFAGDGAAAVVLEDADAGADRARFELTDAHCRSRWSESIRTGMGGTRSFLATSPADGSRPLPGEDAYRWFHQDGPQVYRDVLPQTEAAVRRLLEPHGVAPEHIARWWVHQASVPMIDGIFGRLLGRRPGPDRLPLALGHMGNTSSCGAAWCLAEDPGLARGEHGVLLAFGGGYTVGSLLLTGR